MKTLCDFCHFKLVMLVFLLGVTLSGGLQGMITVVIKTDLKL